MFFCKTKSVHQLLHIVLLPLFVLTSFGSCFHSPSTQNLYWWSPSLSKIRIHLLIGVQLLFLKGYLRKVNDGNKISVAANHGKCLPIREGATDEDLLSTTVPLEYGGKGVLLNRVSRENRIRLQWFRRHRSLGHCAGPLSGLCRELWIRLRGVRGPCLCVIRLVIFLGLVASGWKRGGVEDGVERGDKQRGTHRTVSCRRSTLDLDSPARLHPSPTCAVPAAA